MEDLVEGLYNILFKRWIEVRKSCLTLFGIKKIYNIQPRNRQGDTNSFALFIFDDSLKSLLSVLAFVVLQTYLYYPFGI